ncbi:hypothetical protein PG993_004249 [Apiospora rasikravindrae]|uniref:Uncharacterized protein n=1 Tax=Apiospora rasikravindrae TaxID=990691 RepID=A0ABR1TE60_9PEZI
MVGLRGKVPCVLYQDSAIQGEGDSDTLRSLQRSFGNGRPLPLNGATNPDVSDEARPTLAPHAWQHRARWASDDLDKPGILVVL